MSSQVLLLAALLLAARAAAAESLVLSRPSCLARCGGVDIPYPFGIGSDCFREGFEISCVSNGRADSGRMPVLAATSDPAVQVLRLSVMPRPEARVMLPVAWQCYDSTGVRTGHYNGDVNINRTGVYRISNTGNELVVLGCNTIVYTNSGPRGRFDHAYYAGCVASCNDSQSARDGACAGVGCCHVDIPPGLTDNRMRFAEKGEWSHANQEFSPCDYAFIVEKDHYKFKASHLRSMRLNQTMPLLLDWAIRDNNISMSCAEAANNLGYACLSENSECVDSTNGPGYFCSCTQGYEGNPYLPNGCTNINECLRPGDYTCHGHCRDTEGSYDCKCPPGDHSTGDPKEKPCRLNFSSTAKLALGISIGIFFLAVAALSMLTMYQKRRLSEVFRQNGDPQFQPYRGHDCVEPSAAMQRPGRSPLWDKEMVSHEGAQTSDYGFSEEWPLRREGGGPSHDEITPSKVFVGASQLHGAPRVSQPTQHPIATPMQTTHCGRVPWPPEPLTYSNQRPQSTRQTMLGATRGVHPKRSRQ